MSLKSMASLIAVLTAIAVGFGPRPAAAATSPGVPCSDLAPLTFEGNTTITAATTVRGGMLTTPANQTLSNLPEFCRVIGVSKPTADSHITFEVWLPVNTWNGKFLSSGEGGFAGVLNYTRSGLDGGLDELLRRGYATASTDTGHVSSDELWAIGHPERVADYAYRAKHLVTVAAKGLIAAFYGKPPDHSYFSSCSNGGRQGLIELQRYAADYDGVVVGAPWAFQSHSAAGMVWTAQALAVPGASIPATKLPAIQAAATAACDRIDGLADGLIEDPRKCSFDPSVLLCTTGDNNTCLTQAQVDAVKKLYAGPGATSFGGVGQQIPPVRDAAHDVQTALEAWVEQGVAPNQIVATKYANDAAATTAIRSTRLLCPYPQVPKYKGSGDRADAASFQCVAP